jgi:hypothetical protein
MTAYEVPAAVKKAVVKKGVKENIYIYIYIYMCIYIYACIYIYTNTGMCGDDGIRDACCCQQGS